MRTNKIALPLSMAYALIAVVLFGGVLGETVVLYPNIFHDPPASLTESVEFFVITGPGDYFPQLGMVTVLVGFAALVALWRTRQVRWWVVASVATLVCGDFLVSMLFSWPRNEIMFDEGIAVHSAEFLRETAKEFVAIHWARLAASGVTATLAVTGFVRFHRIAVTAAAGRKPEPVQA